MIIYMHRFIQKRKACPQIYADSKHITILYIIENFILKKKSFPEIKQAI